MWKIFNENGVGKPTKESDSLVSRRVSKLVLPEYGGARETLSEDARTTAQG